MACWWFIELRCWVQIRSRFYWGCFWQIQDTIYFQQMAKAAPRFPRRQLTRWPSWLREPSNKVWSYGLMKPRVWNIASMHETPRRRIGVKWEMTSIQTSLRKRHWHHLWRGLIIQTMSAEEHVRETAVIRWSWRLGVKLRSVSRWRLFPLGLMMTWSPPHRSLVWHSPLTGRKTDGP